MSWIVIQPVENIESTEATGGLLNSGECTFNLGKDGVRLCLVRFESRVCTEFECQYHLFVGEAASGRWVISQNRHYSWGNIFWWMRDCASVKVVLKYEENISQIYR